MARLKEFYRQQVVPALMQELGYTNLMQVPRLQKIVANMGLGSAVQNPKILESGVSELTLITGQKPIVTRAHTSIANFKLREGVSIGCAVTLHGERMYEFFDRLVSIALPRVRDFRGVSEHAFEGIIHWASVNTSSFLNSTSIRSNKSKVSRSRWSPPRGLMRKGARCCAPSVCLSGVNTHGANLFTSQSPTEATVQGPSI